MPITASLTHFDDASWFKSVLQSVMVDTDGEFQKPKGNPLSQLHFVREVDVRSESKI